MSESTKEMLSVGIKLMCITAVTVLLLAGVNVLTETRIAGIESENQIKAMQQLYSSDDTDFAELDISEIKDIYPDVKKVYMAYVKNGSFIKGYCALVSAKGYGGEGSISMMIGISNACFVSDIVILSNEETPGIGTKALEPEFLAQFKDHTVPIEYGDSVKAISGATKSSNGVRIGLNNALNAVKIITGQTDIAEEEGNADE